MVSLKSKVHRLWPVLRCLPSQRDVILSTGLPEQGRCVSLLHQIRKISVAGRVPCASPSLELAHRIRRLAASSCSLKSAICTRVCRTKVAKAS